MWGASYHRDDVPERGEPGSYGLLTSRLAVMLADLDSNSVDIDRVRAVLGITGPSLVDYGASMSVRFYAGGGGDVRFGVVAELAAARATVAHNIGGGQATALMHQWQRSIAALAAVAHNIGGQATGLMHQWQRSIAALAAVDDDGHAVVRGLALPPSPGIILETANVPRVWTVREGLPTSVYFQRSGGVVRVLSVALCADWTRRLIDRVNTPSGAVRRNGDAYRPPAPPWTPPVYGLDITGE